MIESESCARRASSASDAGFRFRVLSFGLRMPSPPALSHPMGEGDRSGTCVTRPSNFMKRLRSLRPVAGHSSLEIRPKNEKKCGKRPPWPFQPQRNVIEMSPMKESESVSEWVSGSERSARCSAAVPGCEFRHRPGACLHSGQVWRRDAARTRRRGRPRYQKLPNESMRSARRFKVSGSRFKADRRSQTAATADSLTLPSPIRWAREPKRRVGHAAYSARRAATAKPEPKKIKVNLGYLRLFKLKKFLAMPTTNGRECTRICETNISKQKGRVKGVAHGEALGAGKRKGERVQGRRGARILGNEQFYETNPFFEEVK